MRRRALRRKIRLRGRSIHKKRRHRNTRSCGLGRRLRLGLYNAVRFVPLFSGSGTVCRRQKQLPVAEDRQGRWQKDRHIIILQRISSLRWGHRLGQELVSIRESPSSCRSSTESAAQRITWTINAHADTQAQGLGPYRPWRMPLGGYIGSRILVYRGRILH
jgi:hypothetical protein